jgi:predicted DNA-binding transcriptional regulator YafY
MEQHSRPPIERMLWLHARLRESRYPKASDVARTFEVSDRTAYRDIRFLRDRLGAPLAFDRGRNGYYYTRDDYEFPSIPLTEGEMFAVLIAGKVLREYTDTRYENQLRQAFGKIVKRLPESASLSLADVDTSITFDVGPVSPVDAEVYDAFVRATMNRRRLHITYRGAYRDEVTERTIDVYHLWNRDGDWYAIAHDHLRGEMRHFLLSRVIDADLTDEPFPVPESFDVTEYLAESFGAERGNSAVGVSIRFDSYQARWIREREWHPTQRVQELDDGGLILSFRVTGLDEVKRWVLQHGSHAEALEPPELRSAIAEELHQMRATYRTLGSAPEAREEE